MSSFLEAQELDVAQKIGAAAAAYEQVIQFPDAPIDAFINLACLYWQSTDFGFNAYFHLSYSFIDLAAKRQLEVLDEAEQQCGKFPEITFWKLYFPFIPLGEEPFLDKALELIALPHATKTPYFYIYAASYEAPQYIPEISNLYKEVQSLRTTKNRYIASVLDSHTLHWRTG